MKAVVSIIVNKDYTNIELSPVFAGKINFASSEYRTENISAEMINRGDPNNNTYNLNTFITMIEEAWYSYSKKVKITDVDMFGKFILVVAIYNYIKDNKDLYITDDSIIVNGIKYGFSHAGDFTFTDAEPVKQDDEFENKAKEIVKAFIKDKKLALFGLEINQARLASGDKDFIKEFVDLYRERIALVNHYWRISHGDRYIRNSRWITHANPYVNRRNLANTYHDRNADQRAITHNMINKPSEELLRFGAGKPVNINFIKQILPNKLTIDEVVPIRDEFIVAKDDIFTNSNKVKNILRGNSTYYDFSNGAILKGTKKYPVIYRISINKWPKILMSNYMSNMILNNHLSYFNDEEFHNSLCRWLIPCSTEELNDYMKIIDIINNDLKGKKGLFRKASVYYIYALQENILSLSKEQRDQIMSMYYSHLYNEIQSNITSIKYKNFIQALSESQISV